MEIIKVQDLLETSLFQCKRCKRRLSPPIMDVQNLGTICGRCFCQNAHTNAKENQDMSSIMIKLRTSCNYSKQGCQFQGSFVETTAHEDGCPFQERICPFNYVNKCNCTLPFASIADHIKKKHFEYVIHYSSNLIRINTNLNEEYNEFRLLSIDKDDYILRIKSDQKSLHFLIYYFKSEKRIFSIHHENGDFITRTKDCTALHEARLGEVFDVDNATTFDLAVLEKCFDKHITTNIKISSPPYEIANKKLLKLMECPVCNEYMTQQIRQCLQGHSLCKTCRNKLQECPLCKAAFGASRNYTLESLTSEIHFPCKNFGCPLYITGDNIDKHELECLYKNYQCPFLIKLNCKWKGLHCDITEHLVTEHSEFTEFTNFVQRKMILDYVNHKYDTICIVLGENIFKVCVCVNGANKLFLTYGLYGPASTASKFYWEMGVYHKTSDRHKFVVKDVCSTYHTTNYKLDIEGYGVDNVIHFYHRVTPNCSICA